MYRVHIFTRTIKVSWISLSCQKFRNPISLTALFALTAKKKHEKFRGLHTVTVVCPAFLIDGRFLSELRGSLFYFLFRLFEPELTVLPAFLLFAACTSVATCMFFNFMTRTTFIAKKRRKKVQLINFTSYVTCTDVLLSRNPQRSRST